MARKRSFKKLREHLTSDDIDKKIEYLESRMPTNNTALVFQGDPSNPQGNSFETIVDGEENETDYTVGEKSIRCNRGKRYIRIIQRRW